MSARRLVNRDALKLALECFNPSANTLYDFIEAYEQFKRNTPDTGEVDEEAFQDAHWASRGEGWANRGEQLRAALEAYEAAKLNKVMEGSGKGSARAETDSMEAAQALNLDAQNQPKKE